MYSSGQFIYVGGHMSDRILRLPEVMDRVGLSKSMIYKLIGYDDFPKPVKLSLRSSGWIESEVDEWFAERKRNR